MKLRIVLTTASLTFLILALPQNKKAQSTTINAASNQSNDSQNKPREANEYDHNARLGMYFAVLCELSSASGQTEQAKVYAENAVPLLQNPGDAFEFYAKGAAYVVLKKYDMALVSFSRAIEQDPQKIIAYIRRGRLHSQNGHFVRALADFDKAIQIDPLLKNAHSNRGSAFSAKGDEARARADFALEEQLFPDQSSGPLNVLNGRALKLVTPGYPDSARRAHASGTVVVNVLIDEKGKVIAAKAISGHPLLLDVSVRAAKDSLFSPTLLADKPVKVHGLIQYNFVAR